jgi:hypothetical protein
MVKVFSLQSLIFKERLKLLTSVPFTVKLLFPSAHHLDAGEQRAINESSTYRARRPRTRAVTNTFTRRHLRFMLRGAQLRVVAVIVFHARTP